MKKNKIIILLPVIVILIAAGAAAAVFLLRGQRNPAAEPESEATYLLTESLAISAPFSYSGPYVEDGSDAPVADIAAIHLYNGGDTDYQYVEFTVETEGGSYRFTASSVHAGTATTVLEADRQTFRAGETPQNAECSSLAEYMTPPSLRGDLFEVYQAPGAVNLRNRTDKDLTGTITVYYKQTDENGFLGGITYRATIPGIRAGEIQQRSSAHLDQVVAITYEE